MKLENKVALVTGSSRGIGRATALALAREGCNVVVNYIGSEEKAKEVAEEIKNMGRESLVVKADVSKVSDLKQLVEKTMEKFGKIDILVNNAGILLRTKYEDFTEEDFDNTMNTNVKAIQFLSREVGNIMLKQKSGKIINLSSQAGFTGNKKYIEYCASKAAVLSLTKSFALALAPHVNVNCVSPGFIMTDMTFYDKDPEKKKKRESQVPLGRIGEPEEIASAVVFLASDDASYITGENISVDGGSMI